MPNRLANETSPYLLQHADNPVDWYPWGPEAFALAKTTDRPILLSVGYSSCHWCHVMAHESFEDAATATRMNEWFVNVKVDREERPDVDGVYMTAVQALTGRGGWPMTVFMTADGRPFYAGTYFPPEDGHGLPSFGRVLEAIHSHWVDERERLMASAEGVTSHLEAAARRASAAGAFELSPALVQQAVQSFSASFDGDWGGFGQAPKFPSPGNLEFLLAHHATARFSGDAGADSLAMVERTLLGMATGGMYDQLGGGFSRYSVDAHWLVPHFEKMLYDNAQLVRVYLHAWQVTRDPFYERVVRETLTYLEREMRHDEGGFYSAQDADSEGVEGKFFVWTVDQVREVLGEDAEFFCRLSDITPEGNFRDPHHPELTGRSVVSRRYDLDAEAAATGLTPEEIESRMGQLRHRLFEERSSRIPPGLDDKVLASWNGLALAAFAESAHVLGDEHLREIALANASFLKRAFWKDGRLLHTWKDGRAHIDGMVEDYAYLGLGLIELYRLTGEEPHLDWARELFVVLDTDFRDPDRGGFFESSHSGEQLIVRQKSYFDSATPSGNGAASLLAFLLGRYDDREDWLDIAREVLGLTHEFLLQAPSGFGSLWQVVALMLAPRQELAIVGGHAERRELLRVADEQFHPWLIVAHTEPGQARLPLFEGRQAPGPARAYLCENMSCLLPAASPAELRSQLAGT